MFILVYSTGLWWIWEVVYDFLEVHVQQYLWLKLWYNCFGASVGIHRINRGVGIHSCRVSYVDQDIGFGGTVWYTYMETYKEEEVEHVLMEAPLEVEEGTVD